MRLRRETGDFNILLNDANSNSQAIRKGLNGEDLIGQVATVGSKNLVITETSAGVTNGVITLKAGTESLSYNAETGIISKSA